MNYSEDMTTSISDLRNLQENNNSRRNLAQKIEYEMDNFDYNPDVIPQSTLQKAPPMRNGQIENFPTHQTVSQNNFYPTMYPQQNIRQNNISQNIPLPEKKNQMGIMGGFFDGLYQRLVDPIIIVILFIIFAHRITAKGLNSYLPFVGMSPSTDLVSLGLRGFMVGVLYLMLRNYLIKN